MGQTINVAELEKEDFDKMTYEARERIDLMLGKDMMKDIMKYMQVRRKLGIVPALFEKVVNDIQSYEEEFPKKKFGSNEELFEEKKKAVLLTQPFFYYPFSQEFLNTPVPNKGEKCPSCGGFHGTPNKEESSDSEEEGQNNAE